MVKKFYLGMAAAFAAAALLFPSCAEKEPAALPDGGDELVDFYVRAEPAGLLSVTVDPRGKVISSEVVDPAAPETRSKFTGDVKAIKTYNYAIYRADDGAFVQASSDGHFEQVSRRKSYKLFFVGNMPGFDFSRYADTSALREASFPVPSYSDMNAGGMPHSGRYPGVISFNDASAPTAFSLTAYRLYSAVQVVYNVPSGTTYTPSDVVLKELSGTSQNASVRPFGTSTLTGDAASEVDAVVNQTVTAFSPEPQHVIYLPENLGAADAKKTHVKFDMTYMVNGVAKEHRMAFAPYYMLDGVKQADQLRRNVVMTIDAFALVKGDLDAVTVEPWDGTDVYVGQKGTATTTVTVPSGSTDDLTVTIGGGATSTGSPVFGGTDGDKTRTVSVPYDATKGETATITVKSGDKVVSTATFTPAKPLLRFVATSYGLKNNGNGSSDATPYALRYYTADGQHEMSTAATDPKYKFDAALYDTYLVPTASQANQTVNARIRSLLKGFTANSLSGDFNFNGSKFIEASYDGTYSDELVASARGGSSCASPAYATVTISGNSVVISKVDYSDPGLYVAQKKDGLSITVYNPLQKTLTVASSNASSLTAAKASQTKSGNNTVVTVNVGARHTGTQSFTVSDGTTTLTYSVAVKTPLLRWSSDSYRLYLKDYVGDAGDDIQSVAASYAYYREDGVTKMSASDFDASLYAELLAPVDNMGVATDEDGDDLHYFVIWSDSGRTALRLGHIFFHGDAQTFDGGLVVSPKSSSCGVGSGTASLKLDNGRVLDASVNTGDWDQQLTSPRILICS